MTSPGDRFERLVAVAPAGGGKWLYRCSCGGELAAFASNVKRGLTRSCGCLRREVSAAKNRTHGLTSGGRHDRTMKAWSHAKERCYDANNRSYPDYGGRGVSMAQRWRDSFSAFLEDMGECPPGLTLDRIDSNGHYAPGNCRWVSRTVQGRNRRGVHMVEFAGREMALSEACEVAGVDYQRTYHQVVRRGLSFEAAAAHVRSEPVGARPTRRRYQPPAVRAASKVRA